MTAVIPPGSVIGVLGSGQLGRMLAIAARRLGYRVHTYSPEADTPLGHVADQEIAAAYDDLDAVRDFARGVDVLTFEFENVPSSAAAEAERFVPVRPSGSLLHTTQNRLREKTALADAGFPVTPFRAVRSAGDLDAALSALGSRGVLKSAGWGYDGKGQTRVESAARAQEARAAFGGQDVIYEQLIDFTHEISVVGARGVGGDFAHFGAIENRHRNHVLHTSVVPAAVPAPVAAQAVEIVRTIMHDWEVVGVLCAEFFVDQDGRLLINELAPRPHNSGHLTIDACLTCQFEQQVRAVCGLALGRAAYHAPAAMVNVLGDAWQDGDPDWGTVAALGDVKLHLYGKREPRPGRKMAHLTALASTPQDALQRVEYAHGLLAGRSCTPSPA